MSEVSTDFDMDNKSQENQNDLRDLIKDSRYQGIKGVYYKLEDGWYSLMEKMGLDGMMHSIDKVFPSMILFVIIFLAIILLIIFFALGPSVQNVSIEFKEDGLRITDTFPFNVKVGDQTFNVVANEGIANLELPRADQIEILNLELEGYSPFNTVFNFSEQINVNLEKIISTIPVEIYLYANGASYDGDASVSLTCSDSDLPTEERSKTSQDGSVVVNIPEDCGILNVNAIADGYKNKNDSCNSTVCQISFEALSETGDNGNTVYATGNLLVRIYNSLGELISGASLRLYEKLDQQNEVDLGLTSELGARVFNNLIIGDYVVYASMDGFLPIQQEVIVLENETNELEIRLTTQSLGTANLSFYDEDEKVAEGSFVLKDKEGEVVYRGETAEGKLSIPIISYIGYYFDFAPDNTELVGFANEEIAFNSTKTNYGFYVKDKQSFSIAKVNLKVLDEDENPVEGAEIFVQDVVTGFELFNYEIIPTGSNGKTSVQLPEGIYLFRVYDGLAESFSEQITITSVDAGEVPEYDLNIFLIYGYSLFTLEAHDEFATPMSYSKVFFYNKQSVEQGQKLLGARGKLNHSFKAGKYYYYKVDPEEDYLPFYSESRLVMPRQPWDDNVVMYEEKDEENEIKFLGVFKELDGDAYSELSIGKTYYLGFDIFVYDDPDELHFEFITGTLGDVDKEPLYIIDAYSSANYDIKYLDEDKELETNSDGRSVMSTWNNPTRGVYRVYYKVQVRNDSSVRLYDPLQVNANLYTENDDDVDEDFEKVFLAGAKSYCNSNEFCSRVAILDIEEDLYVDSTKDFTYGLSPSKEYEISFDIINGINSIEGEINKGYLQIFNAETEDESYETVKNNTAKRSYFKQTYLQLTNPDGTENPAETNERFAIFEEQFNFENFGTNEYIKGVMNLVPVLSDPSYVNFLIIDDERNVVVKGKPALSLNLVPFSAKKLGVEFFPNEMLVPYTTQDLLVTVTDELGSYVYDATVTIKIKQPSSLQYHVYSNCRALKTDVEGEAICQLEGELMSPGTNVQIIVQKEGYQPYAHIDFIPDVRVEEDLFDLNPKTLEVNLVYPVTSEGYADLEITNNASTDLIIEKLELKMDRYSLERQHYLEIEEMQNYLLNIYQDKVIYGREESLSGEPVTKLEDFFKAAFAANAVDAIDDEETLSGLVKVYFKTDTGRSFVKDVPFKVKIVVDGFPTNAGDCLKLGLAEGDSYASDGAKAINIPMIYQNNCIITSPDLIEPVEIKFDKIYMVVGVEDGALGLGNFSFSIPDIASIPNLIMSVPSALMANVSSDLANPDRMSILGFNPSGRKGKANYYTKLIGYVKTTSGLKKIESGKTEFDLSVLNLDECIKIKNEAGEEIEQFDFEILSQDRGLDLVSVGSLSDEYELELENVCEGLPIEIQVCKNNSNDRTPGCGSYMGEYKGLEFSPDLYDQSKEIGEKMKLMVERPMVPGAYSLDIWARQKGQQVSFKKINELKINVRTASISGLFADNPFLEVQEEGRDKNSDVLLLYNAWVPNPDISILEKYFTERGNETGLIKADCEDDGICFGEIKTSRASGAVDKAFFYAGVSVMATTWTVVGALIAASASIPVWGWGIAAGAALVGTIMTMAAAFNGYMDDGEEMKVLVLDEEDIPLINAEYNGNIVIDNLNDILKYNSENRYKYFSTFKWVNGKAGVQGKTYRDSIRFDVECPINYEVYEDGITIFDDDTENCYWSDPKYKVDGRKVTFYPVCKPGQFASILLETYALVPCKLKAEMWGRSQHEGVASGYYNTGLFKVKFKDVDFTDAEMVDETCTDEWCYKTYDVKISDDLLGNVNEIYRVAFHKIREQEPSTYNIGYECKDPSGNVIGFTGEDARPKVEYNWNFIDPEGTDKNFCAVQENKEVERYCDSVQFMGTNLDRIINAHEAIGQLTSNEFNCPSLESEPGDISDVEVLDGEQHLTMSPVIERTDDDYMILTVRFNEIFGTTTGDAPIIVSNGFTAIDSAGNLDINCDVETAIGTNRMLFAPICVINLGAYETLTVPQEEPLLLYHDTITLGVRFEGEPTSRIIKTKVDVDYVWQEATCLTNQPSTKTIDGKMQIFKWFGDDEELEKDLFKVQDSLFYQVYLMDDAFTTDMLNDFSKECDNRFLSCPPGWNNFKTLIQEGRFEIINKYDSSTRLNGPGVYNVYNEVTYGNSDMDLQDENTFLKIYLEKVKAPAQDSAFYYMPLDGHVGIEVNDVERQGYGVDFEHVSGTSDIVKFYDVLGNIVSSTLSTGASNPIKHLSIETDYKFDEMNSGLPTIFKATVLDSHNMRIKFVPSVKVTKFETNLETEQTNVPVDFYYSALHNGNRRGQESLGFYWYPSNFEALDFTGQRLLDTYPRAGVPAQPGEVNDYLYNAKISYNANEVTNASADYDIYTILYHLKGDEISMEGRLNSNRNNLTANDQLDYTPVETFDEVLKGIDENKLCVTGNSYDTTVFINEGKFIPEIGQ
jgi:hypothetical protein